MRQIEQRLTTLRPVEAAVGLLRQSGTFSPDEGADPTEISVMITSPNLFDVLGVSPVLGRGFTATAGSCSISQSMAR